MNIVRKLLGKKRKKRNSIKSKFEWAATGTGAFQHRRYPTYEAYEEHQKSKLRLKRRHQAEGDIKFAAALEQRLSGLKRKTAGNNVLCLAARTGGECVGFVKLGYFPIGIDLNPGQANRYVVNGDFHALQYADKSVDIVFTNSLDHAYDLDRIVKEVHRVLKDEATFITEIVDPTVRQPGDFDAYWWSSIEDVVTKIEAMGFAAQTRQAFDYPWKGTQVVFFKAAMASMAKS